MTRRTEIKGMTFKAVERKNGTKDKRVRNVRMGKM